jgi:hypothetical protein
MHAMCRSPVLAGLLLCLHIAPSYAQVELAPEILLLDHIKARMAENLRRLPNYTCTEVIDRSRRRRGTGEFAPVDTLKLDVALVDGKELFSWLGASQFEETDIREFGRDRGAYSSGDFALEARNIFLTGSPSFTYAGEQNLNGRLALRYDFRVPVESSNYVLRGGAEEARVGYHGSFWADPDTLDLIRLETAADNIPDELEISRVDDGIEYRLTRIGETDFLLPEASELLMIDLSGNASRNRTHFSGCRRYAVESALNLSGSPGKTIPPPPESARQGLEMRAPEILLLDRIKARAAENLRRLPNYTCTEKIERFSEGRLVNKLRVEVVLVDGKELFARPAGEKFEKSEIPQIGHEWAIGNGSFAMHAEFIFQTPWPSFTYVGVTTLNGQRAIRYDYRVPLLLSSYQIRTDLW